MDCWGNDRRWRPGGAQDSDGVVESEDVQVEIQDAEGRVAKLSVKYGQAKDIREGSIISFPPSTY